MTISLAIETKSRAIYEALDPAMTMTWLADGRGDLLHPVVLWAKAESGSSNWSRMSPVIELKLARRWQESWSRGGRVLAITPATRISKTIRLPRY